MSSDLSLNENDISPAKKIILVRKKRRKRTILIIVFSLLAMSVINMISTTSMYSSVPNNAMVVRHVRYILIAVGFGCLVSAMDYRKYHRNSWSRFFLLSSLAILFFVVIGGRVWTAMVPTINGSSGWIRIFGISIQPSEILKLPFIVVIAHLLANCDEKKITNWGIIFTVAPVIAAFSFLISFQNDLGTAIHYFVILAFILFCSKIDIKMIVGGIAVVFGGGLGILGYIYMSGYDTLTSYKSRRIWVFLEGIIKNVYDDNIGYQVGQSIMAFGNGGTIGQGYANGTQKYSYLPEIRTDFIMATFGEEFGFAGMLIFLIGFYILFNVIKSTALDCEDIFGKYLGMGIGGFIITQVLINLYVALGLVPVFGIPMPLFSFGGTSIVTTITGLAIILNMNFPKNKLENQE